jgi:hypothetical protein
MPEALTESFCERCGTRYEFEAPTRLSPLRKTRGLVSGFKNYLTSQEPLGDALSEGIRSEEQELAASQLDAFHAAFNFCIDCRQYACTNCWNEGSGRCRSCAPIAGTDDLVARLESAYHADHPGLNGSPILGDRDHGAPAYDMAASAWPAGDLIETNGAHPAAAWPVEPGLALPALPYELAADERAEAAARQETAPSPGPEPVAPVEAAPIAAELAIPEVPFLVSEPVEAATPIEAAASPEAASSVEAEIEIPLPEPVLAWESDTEFLLAPEPAAEPEYDEYEVEPVAAFAPEPMQPEPPVEVAAPAEAVAEPEPEIPSPVEPFVEPARPPAPLPTLAQPSVPRPIRPITPISETILHVEPPRQPRIAPAPQPAVPFEEPALAARRAKLDLLGLDDPGEGRVPTERGNVLPYRSSGASASTSELARRTGPSPLWDASAREVAAALSAVAVQSCGQCGLSLSASARFCRRCGTQQARSA